MNDRELINLVFNKFGEEILRIARSCQGSYMYVFLVTSENPYRARHAEVSSYRIFEIGEETAGQFASRDDALGRIFRQSVLIYEAGDVCTERHSELLF